MSERNDVFTLLNFVLTEEKSSYKRDPFPDSKEINRKETLYKKKIEAISNEIAKREGIKIED